MDSEWYVRKVRSQLRRARISRGLSLAAVQAESGGRWNRGTVGAYERGDRQIKVETLAELAEFYGVNVRDLLPCEAA